MKLWEIKAMSLKQMFSDTDVQFNETEFSNGSIYENSNTRDKLVRMNDSIRRAIDTFYLYAGTLARMGLFSLDIVEGKRENKISLSSHQYLDIPTRIDVKTYFEFNGVPQLAKIENQINFHYDGYTKEIKFLDRDFASLYEKYNDIMLTFQIWYKMKKANLPLVVDDMTFDLDTLNLPQGLQDMIPYFVKGELYEEDEPTMAARSHALYMQYVNSIQKSYSNVQTKVKRAKIFDK